MNDYIEKKEFGKVFDPLKVKTNIRILTKVNYIPKSIVAMVSRLASLNFIEYILISDDKIEASNLTKHKLKIPVTDSYYPKAIGISILYNVERYYIDFDDIVFQSELEAETLIDAILIDFPSDWEAGSFWDTSKGVLDKMKLKYKNINWI